MLIFVESSNTEKAYLDKQEFHEYLGSPIDDVDKRRRLRVRRPEAYHQPTMYSRRHVNPSRSRVVVMEAHCGLLGGKEMKDACPVVARGICEGLYVRVPYASSLGYDRASGDVHVLALNMSVPSLSDSSGRRR